jgi:hypothetical protein
VKGDILSRARRDRLRVNEETFLASQSIANEELGLGLTRFVLEVENPVIAKPGYRLHARRCGAVERLDPFQQLDSGRQAIQYDSSVITLGLEPPRNLRVAGALHVPIGIVDAYAMMDIGHRSDGRNSLRRSGRANANDEAQ